MVPIPMSDVHLWSPGPKLYFSLRHFSTTGRAGLAFPSKAEKGSLFEGPLQGREAQSLKLDLVIFYPVILCRVCEGFSSALEISTFEAYPWKRVCPPTHTHLSGPSLSSTFCGVCLAGTAEYPCVVRGTAIMRERTPSSSSGLVTTRSLRASSLEKGGLA